MRCATQNQRFASIVAALAMLVGITLAQTTGKPFIQAALDEAGHALKRYQGTLASVNDLPDLDATVRAESQVVLSGRNTVGWLKSKLDLEGTVDSFEFDGLLDSLDACAANAPLSSSALSAAVAKTGSARELKSAEDLLSNADELRDAAHHLRQALKPYRQSEKPPRIT
jgi:hypothetical protein